MAAKLSKKLVDGSFHPRPGPDAGRLRTHIAERDDEAFNAFTSNAWGLSMVDTRLEPGQASLSGTRKLGEPGLGIDDEPRSR